MVTLHKDHSLTTYEHGTMTGDLILYILFITAQVTASMCVCVCVRVFACHGIVKTFDCVFLFGNYP